MKRIALGLLIWLGLAGAALGQTTPAWTRGYVPTAGEWNALWASKQDWLGAPPVLTTGGTMTGELITVASTTATAGFNLPPGAAPTSPANGDIWTTTAGVYVRINGSTVGPLAAAGSGSITVGTTVISGGTTTRIIYDNAGVVGEYTLSGSGTAVAMAAGPTFTTPTLGVATGTSLALGACTIGSNSLCTAGTAAFTGAVTLTGGLNTPLVVAQGGTGLAAGTSGGIPAYTGSTTIASSSVLSASNPVIGGGAGVAPSSGTRSGNTTVFGTTSGTLTNGHCVSIDGSGNLVDAGGSCTTGGGGGTVNSGTAGQLTYYASTGTAVSGNANGTVSGSDFTFGVAGSAVGTLSFANATSGSIKLTPPTGALGVRVLTLPVATDTLVGKATTDTLTNKTFDTAGTGNSFSINGVAATANTGTGSVVRDTSPSLTTPTLGVAVVTSVNKVTITAPATSAVLTIPDGVTLTGPAASGTAMTLGNTETVTGIKTFGSSGAVGRLKVAGTTSGSTVLDATAIASGTLTLPAATDTLVGKATTDTLTNKTFDTAGTGNSFSINGVAATANTGTGAVARAAGPTFTTPTLGVAAATTINKVTITAPATGSTLTIADGKTLTVSNSGTLAGGDAFVLAIAAAKTLTVSNSLTFVGTDSTTITFQGTGTYISRDSTDTLTNKTYDTAGTGNSFSINGVAATANTGTGAIARAAGPTFTTPTLGVATGTSLALGGCTIGSNAFCASGTSSIAGLTVTGAFTATGLVTNASLANSSVTYGTTAVALGASSTSIAGLTSVGITSGNTLNWNSDTYLGRFAAATLQLGQADAASPVAQTIAVQNVVAGTSNTAGVDWTFGGSRGTGTGAGGALVLQTAPAGTTGTSQNALVERMRIMSTGNVGIGTNSPQALLHVNANVTQNLAPQNAGTTFYSNQVDGVTAFNYNEWTAHGTAAGVVFLGRVSRGTAASPTALGSGQFIFQFQVAGRDDTAWTTGSAGGFTVATGSAWTSTDHATSIRFITTPTASVTAAEAMRVQPSGGLSVGTTTDPGIGSLQLNAQIFMPNITTSSAAQTGTVCWTTGTGKFTVDTTVGCLASIMGAKNVTERLSSEKALSIVTRLSPFAFRYKHGYGDGGRYEQFGLGAEEVATVDERLVGRDPEGTMQGVRYQEMTAVLAGAIQQLKADNDNLRAAISDLQKTVNRR